MTELPKEHNIIMENRKKMIMTGVKDVESYNENEMLLFTELGALKIKGRAMELTKVSVETGELEMKGEIISVQYGRKEKVPNNLVTKLFR